MSEGPFASLNLGILTEDDPASVVENRIRLCDSVGADPDGATMAWQRHGATVTRAQPRGIVTPGTVYDHCDGLWSDEPGRAMLLLTADCIPIAIARAGGESAPRSASSTRAGAGCSPASSRPACAQSARATSPPRSARASARAATRWGTRSPTPFREAFGDDVVRDGKLDLWTSAERALRAAGCEHVDRFDICTSCDAERFFSHRRDNGKTGRQGVIAYVA